jgi:hypothetical protein
LKANVSSVTSAVTDYNNLVTTLTGLSGGTNIAINPGAGGQTLSTPGLYNATSFLMNGGNLTLSGNATDQYVIRIPEIPSSISITSGSIVLTGGLKPDNVIFLFDPAPRGKTSTGTAREVLAAFCWVTQTLQLWCLITLVWAPAA